jgi:hypothetical protein
MPTPQTYKNHTRWDPPFHFFLMPVFLLNIVATSIWYWHHRYHHIHSGPWAIVVSIALFVLLAKTRLYALQVQDRVIRLEEKHRLAALVSPSELIELDSLTTKQYVALRFASNAELPDLARRTIREKLAPKQIKEAIVSWRPDYDRV